MSQSLATESKRARWSDTLTIGLSIIITVTSFIIFKQETGDLFTLKFNAYALLPTIEVLVHVALLFILIRKTGFFQARSWLSIEIIGGTILGVGEIMMRLSTNPEQALFWARVSVFGISFIPIGFYMFTHHFINKLSKQNDILPAVIISVTGALLMSLTISSFTVEQITIQLGPWGYSPPYTPAFILLMLWLAVIIALCITQLIKFAEKTESIKHCRQINIIIKGASSALFLAMFFDIVPRYFGYDILPVGVLLQTVLPAAIIYAIYKYNAFGIDLAASANDILDKLTEAVIVTDANYKVVFINSFGVTLLGYDKSWLQGKLISRLFDPMEFSKVTNQLLHAPNGGASTYSNETEVTAANGSNISINLGVSKLQTGVKSYMFVLSDISGIKKYYEAEQKRNLELEYANKAFVDQQRAMVNLLEDSRDLSEQLQHEKQDVENKVLLRTKEVLAERTRLEASINSLNIGFIIVDASLETITTNQALVDIIGGSSSSTRLTVKEVDTALKGNINLLTTMKTSLQSGKSLTKNNVKFGEKVLRIFIAPVFNSADKTSMGAVILIEDISEAKAIERSRDEFFSIASHELRTPLTAIRGNTRMIMDYYKEQLTDPTLVEMIDDIHDSSIRLITIVNDFLDTSRLEQGKITFNITEFDVSDLVKDIAQEFKAGAVNPNLHIKIKVPIKFLPTVKADRDRLKQAIINLVGNAFKFTEKGGVTIILKPEGKIMFISVIDTGKGIPVESQNLLFKKFQQASNNILTRDSTRSTGLGLYISKLILHGMGGKIYLKTSEVGKGSEFVIEVPVA